MNRERNCPYPLVYRHVASSIEVCFRKVDANNYENEHGTPITVGKLRAQYEYVYSKKVIQLWATSPNGFKYRVLPKKMIKETV